MLLILLASLASPPVPLPAIGVAWLTDRSACAIIEAPALPPGSELTIVLPQLPQQAFDARIVSNVDTCASPEGGSHVSDDDGGQSLAYEIRLSAAGLDAAGLGVVFVGRFPMKKLTDAYELRLSDIYPRVRVRSCTSMEGVHLSVWSGTPRASRRLWQTYWYLGYDVEPTCDDDETRSTPP